MDSILEQPSFSHQIGSAGVVCVWVWDHVQLQYRKVRLGEMATISIEPKLILFCTLRFIALHIFRLAWFLSIFGCTKFSAIILQLWPKESTFYVKANRILSYICRHYCDLLTQIRFNFHLIYLICVNCGERKKPSRRSLYFDNSKPITIRTVIISILWHSIEFGVGFDLFIKNKNSFWL